MKATPEDALGAGTADHIGSWLGLELEKTARFNAVQSMLEDFEVARAQSSSLGQSSSRVTTVLSSCYYYLAYTLNKYFK